MEQLGRIFGHECEWIHLMGGEPLLHPDIIDVMKIARDNFTYGKIQIVTNGILLSQKEDMFWRACHDNNIQVCVTHYPIKIDIDKIKSLAQNYDVELVWYGYAEEKNVFFKRPLSLLGNMDGARSFALCQTANVCIALNHGRLYTCPMASNVHHFNKKFGEKIVVTEADYIDIYKTTDREEILRKLSSPIPSCRYCDVSGIRRDIKWHISEKDMSEWV